MKASFNPPRPPRTNFFNSQSAGRLNGIYVGVVKNNVDVQRMGRLAVWIPEHGGDPADSTGWFTVSYASPFAGVTPATSLVQNSTDMSGSQQSYGFWMVPPDIDNQVLVCFVNGNTSKGFWFGCLYQQNMDYMVPGIAAGAAPGNQMIANSNPVVVEYNKWSNENPDTPHRPIFKPLSDGLSSQGLYPDPERGPSSTSARREAPSKVFGWLTPRGNSVHVDDNPDNEFIRLRTRSGAQVLIHETTGYVYINSKEGNSWAEISDKGIDLYSQGTISVRAEGSLNLRSDASMNFESVGNMNFRTGGNLTMQSAHNTDIAGNGHLVLQFGAQASLKSAGILLDSSGALRLGANGDLTMASSGNNVRSASAIYDNSSPSAPSPGAPSATVPTPANLPDIGGSAPAYSNSNTSTITLRMPSHEPFANHPSTSNASLSIVSSTEFASPSDAAEAANSNVVATNGPANVTADDMDWLTVCLLTEAGGLGNDMQAAVGQVVMNRVATTFSQNKLNGNWSGIKQFVLAYAAFSYFWSTNGASLNVGSPMRVNGRIQVTDALFQSGEQRGLQKIQASKGSASWNACAAVAKQIAAGTYSGGSNVALIKANKRCTMYANLSLVQPAWATPAKFVTQVGNPRLSHSFYLS
jgi:hypothetical protein